MIISKEEQVTVGSLDTKWKQPQKRGKKAPYCTTSFIAGRDRFLVFCRGTNNSEIYDPKTKKFFIYERVDQSQNEQTTPKISEEQLENYMRE